MLNEADMVLNTLSKDPKMNQFTQPILFHSDMRPCNIFILTTDHSFTISDMIDRQFCSAEPVYMWQLKPIFWYNMSNDSYIAKVKVVIEYLPNSRRSSTPTQISFAQLPKSQ